MVQVNFGSLKNDDPTQRFFSKDLAGGALLDIGGYATAFARMFLDTPHVAETSVKFFETGVDEMSGDRKSTRLNSSHVSISYAVFCLKKKTIYVRLAIGLAKWQINGVLKENRV